LLEIAQKGDIVLVEQIDRISRLKDDDWNSLKSIIKTKGLRVASLDWLTSHQFSITNARSRYFCESLIWASEPKQAAKT
jgi:DNA invertase Pin-like site-specific DNA recombinase